MIENKMDWQDREEEREVAYTEKARGVTEKRKESGVAKVKGSEKIWLC